MTVGYRLLERGTSVDYKLKKTPIDIKGNDFQLYVQVTKNDTPYTLILKTINNKGVISSGVESNTIMVKGVGVEDTN